MNPWIEIPNVAPEKCLRLCLKLDFFQVQQQPAMTVNAAPAAAAPPVQQAQVVSVRTANGQIVQVSTNYITIQ